MFRTSNTLASSALALLLTAAAASSAQAAVFQVTKFGDTADGTCNHDCSLREAVIAANLSNGADVILLNTGTYVLTRAGAGEDQADSGDLDIQDDITVVGQNAVNTILDADALDRAFDVHAGAALELIGLTVRNGLTDHEPGGGIRVAGGLTVTRGVITGNIAADDFGGGVHGEGAASSIRLLQSTVSYNVAANGGGVSSEGIVDLINSTLSGNAASGSGGGLYAASKSHGVVSNSTVTANSALVKGGGVFVESDPFISVEHPTFENSIVAGNGAGATADCSGSALSAGHNLIGIGAGCLDFSASHSDTVGTTAAPINPSLAALASAGGNTPVHVPQAPSQAINHGSGCEEIDQRGAVRPASCDIGSVEITQQCLNGGTTLCVQEARFKLEVAWASPNAGSGQGFATPLTDDSGYFWFFDPANVEMTVKVLDGCGLNNRYWVFVSGLTNVGVTLKVTDLETGTVKMYVNPVNQTFKTVTDTGAFACP